MSAKTATATAKKNSPGTQSTKAAKPPKLSRLIQPADLSIEEWQIALRRQYGQEQNFALRNIGDQKIFSDFEITNPTSRGVYRVAIRSEFFFAVAVAVLADIVLFLSGVHSRSRDG